VIFNPLVGLVTFFENKKPATFERAFAEAWRVTVWNYIRSKRDAIIVIADKESLFTVRTDAEVVMQPPVQ
jgi:hypothetical protein